MRDLILIFVHRCAKPQPSRFKDLHSLGHYVYYDADPDRLHIEHFLLLIIMCNCVISSLTHI